jgi:hypothetical protein
MTYKSILPDVFPHGFIVPTSLAKQISELCLLKDDDAPNGSSFAITSDAPKGQSVLWLSNVSFNRTLKAGIFPYETKEF